MCINTVLPSNRFVVVFLLGPVNYVITLIKRLKTLCFDCHEFVVDPKKFPPYNDCVVCGFEKSRGIVVLRCVLRWPDIRRRESWHCRHTFIPLTVTNYRFCHDKKHVLNIARTWQTKHGKQQHYLPGFVCLGSLRAKLSLSGLPGLHFPCYVFRKMQCFEDCVVAGAADHREPQKTQKCFQKQFNSCKRCGMLHFSRTITQNSFSCQTLAYE